MQLYAPSFQNGGVVSIDGFRHQPGKPLQDTRLEKLGVTLTCLTKETHEAAKAARHAASKQRFISTVDQQTDGLFPGILGASETTGRNYVVLKSDDPQHQVAGFAFGEPDGRLFPVAQTRSADSMCGFYFQTQVPENLMVYVYLAVPEALETVPFRVRNIALP